MSGICANPAIPLRKRLGPLPLLLQLVSGHLPRQRRGRRVLGRCLQRRAEGAEGLLQPGWIWVSMVNEWLRYGYQVGGWATPLKNMKVTWDD